MLATAATAPRTRKCRRCKGTGTVDCYLHVDMGRCITCGGSGAVQVFTAEEKATRDAWAARVIAAVAAVKAVITDMPYGTDRYAAEDGLTRLRDTEPERFARLVASVEAGRVPAVVAALIDYTRKA